MARRFVAARDGDKLQARRRVNYLVERGELPRPADLACSDCGHIAAEGEPHGYDHFLGYAGQYHEIVEAVCARCSVRRSWNRGEITVEQQRHAASCQTRKTHCRFGHAITRWADGRRGCAVCDLARHAASKRRRRAATRESRMTNG